MATLVNKTTSPNYIAESSEISGSAISGVSIVGATVFMTDTAEWYIVKPDLTLATYKLPSLYA